ncbi:NAD(P)H-quinone oxidoreductase [Colwelliaceae bacterium 6471]
MKYIRVLENKQLSIASTLKPQPGADECLIRVRAIGINRADLLQRDGKYPAPKGESSILGLEISGEVVESDSKGRWQKGAKVFGLVAGGGYAQYVKVKSSHLMKLPEHFTFAQGAATAETFLTAYQSLFTIAKLQSGQSVLLHAGASGVGTAAIQLAKSMGCNVVVTVGSNEKAKACLLLGADAVINYNEEDFVEWTQKNYPQGFDVILDVVAGNYLNKNIIVAALDANIVILAMLGGRYSDAVDIAKLLMKRITVSASTLRNRSDSYKEHLVNSFITEFGENLNNGSIGPVIDTEFDWQNADAAHQKMAANANIGKLVLNMSDNDEPA